MENLGIGSPGSDPNKKSNQNVIDHICDFIKQAPIFNLQKTMAQDRGPTGQGNRTGDVGTIQELTEGLRP